MIERLREMYGMQPPMTMSQMAKELGREFPEYQGSLTRSAISGKISRIRRKYPEAFPMRVDAVCKTKLHRLPTAEYQVKKINEIENIPKKTLDVFMVNGRKGTKHLHELRTCECRWPLTHPSGMMKFCAKRTEDLCPYCAEHRAIANRPTPVVHSLTYLR